MLSTITLVTIGIYVYLVMYVLKDTSQQILASLAALFLLLPRDVAGFTDDVDDSNVSNNTVNENSNNSI